MISNLQDCLQLHQSTMAGWDFGKQEFFENWGFLGEFLKNFGNFWGQPSFLSKY
jgi:hypothetical protein